MDWITTAAAIVGLLTSLVSIYIALKKTPHETLRLDAETGKAEAEINNIHAQTADRWAEHVGELMDEIEALKADREAVRKELAGVRMDIAQVRRENEEYRHENADLKDWIERLLAQFKKHAPDVEPEKYIRRSVIVAKETL